MLFRGYRGYHKGSVLPPLAAKRTAEGFLLTIDRSGHLPHLRFLAMALALLVSALLCIWLLRSGAWPQALESIGYTAVLAACVVAIGKLLHLRKASLLVSRWPLRLGEEIDLQFRAFVRRGALAVTAQLRCVEQTSKKARKGVVSESVTLYATDLSQADWDGPRTAVAAQWRMTVPETMPPSFAVLGNAVRWHLHADIHTTGADVPVTFELQIIPEIAE